MKLIFHIARTELRNLFFSPVAWVLIIMFFVICAGYYSSSIFALANYQDSAMRTMPSFEGFVNGLTMPIFMNIKSQGFISSIFSNLYLFIPLLTMGVINREFNAGTVKLLYSSPVKLNQIVLGKYLALMVFNLILLAVMVFFMILGAFSIANIDTGHLFAGIIAFYLVVCSYTAIGMFMSSITNYQIVAAIGTFILLFLLQKVGGLWQEYEFVRELSYFLSINGRADRMLKGLITSRDIIYYALITYLFVSFTCLSLRHQRELVSRVKKTARYVVLFLFVLATGYLTSRPGLVAYWDSTRNQDNTISEKFQNILKGMQEEPLEVTLYTNLLDPGLGFGYTRPESRMVYIWDFWERYVRFKPNINFNYVLYYDVKDGDSTLYKRMPGLSLDSIAAEYAKIYRTDIDRYLKPEEIRKIISLQEEGMRSVMQLNYKGKNIFLRTYEDGEFWPFDSHVAAALKRLSNDTISQIYATTGNLERSLHKRGEREHSFYSIDKLHRYSLINNGFEVDTLNLSMHNIPLDASALIIADPKVVLNDSVTIRLKQYIEKGGNALILGEPTKQHVLNPLIKPMGVELMPATLVQLSKDETPDKIFPYYTLDHTWLLKEPSDFTKAVRKGILAGGASTFIYPGTAPLSFVDTAFKVTRLMVTDPKKKVWAEATPLVLDSAAPVFDSKEGDYMLDSFNVVLALSKQIGKREQRVVIAGDADFVSNIRSITGTKLATDYLSWITYEAFPFNILSIPKIDTLLTISLNAAKTQKTILFWILPAAFIALGIVVLFRRKRQ